MASITKIKYRMTKKNMDPGPGPWAPPESDLAFT